MKAVEEILKDDKITAELDVCNRLFPAWLRLEPRINETYDGIHIDVEGHFDESSDAFEQEIPTVDWTENVLHKSDTTATSERQRRCVIVQASAPQLAAHCGKQKILEALVDHHTFKPNVVNADRQTVLHVAVRRQSSAMEDVVEMLLDRGVDSELVDNDNLKVGLLFHPISHFHLRPNFVLCFAGHGTRPAAIE